MVSHMLLNALIAAACCAVIAFVVLPSLAGDEVYSNVAAALRHTGHSLSGYTFCLCLSAAVELNAARSLIMWHVGVLLRLHCTSMLMFAACDCTDVLLRASCLCMQATPSLLHFCIATVLPCHRPADRL